MKHFGRGIPITVAATLTIAAVFAVGCASKGTPVAPGLAGQQKGVMGGTPPPGELAKIAAQQAEEQKKQAAAQAAEQAKAQAGGGTQ